MKKSIFMVALAAIAMTSCSQDEIIEVQKDAVSFSVVANKSSRAVTTTGTINGFKVWGLATEADQVAQGKIFMNGVEVTKPSGSWVYSPVQYWPNGGTVDFYAISPIEIANTNTVSVAKAGKTIKYTVDNVNEDLLYAVNMGCSKATGQVGLNFRHALSQLEFKAQVTDPTLKVVIKGVKVYHIANSATLTLPEFTTNDPDYSSAADGTNDTEIAGPISGVKAWGEWTTATGDVNYAATFVAATDVTLTKSTVDQPLAISSTTDPLLVMPQTLTPATLTSGKMNLTSGTYFAINCTIYSVCGSEETQLWPTTVGASAEVAIPATAITWKQGKKYVYTFNFGEGAGYEGDETTDTAADPVLAKVSFAVTVDEFQTETVPVIGM